MFSDAAKPMQSIVYSTSVASQPYQTCVDLKTYSSWHEGFFSTK